MGFLSKNRWEVWKGRRSSQNTDLYLNTERRQQIWFKDPSRSQSCLFRTTNSSSHCSEEPTSEGLQGVITFCFQIITRWQNKHKNNIMVSPKKTKQINLKCLLIVCTFKTAVWLCVYFSVSLSQKIWMCLYIHTSFTHCFFLGCGDLMSFPIIVKRNKERNLKPSHIRGRMS